MAREAECRQDLSGCSRVAVEIITGPDPKWISSILFLPGQYARALCRPAEEAERDIFLTSRSSMTTIA
ncbi:MAG: hypothetical protein K5657_07625 [Desulfovibrio sp.]|nr:hypothetical protein [Desulfovibrio sp.]